jgi:hypothetical protein
LKVKYLLIFITLAINGYAANSLAEEPTVNRWPDAPYYEDMATRFGKLTTNNDHILMLNGTPVEPSVTGDPYLAFTYRMPLREGEAVLMQNAHGSSCPAIFQWIFLSANGYRITPEFGACSDYVRVFSRDGNLVVQTPDRGFRTHTYVFDSINLTEDGRPVR